MKILFLALFISATTNATTILCGAEFANNESQDAGPTIQKCIDQASPNEKTTIELKAGVYNLQTPIHINHKKDITLQTQGRALGVACLTTGAADCAVLKANSKFRDGPFLQSVNSERLRFEAIALDGNITERRKNLGNKWGREAFNAGIHECLDCHFQSFASVNAVFGTELEYIGDRAVFENCNFSNNGLGLNVYLAGLAWADGLTVLSSDGLKVRNSIFWNNSDVGLILGHAPNSVIENNRIENTWNFAFAGLMLDNFNNSRKGDFTNSIVQNNVIEGGAEAMVGIGIDVGPLFWYKSDFIEGGLVQNNKINKARQGILIAGAKNTVFVNNSITNRADYQTTFRSCRTSDIDIIGESNVRIDADARKITRGQMRSCGPTDLPKMSR